MLKVISCDLDDALYENRPVICRAERVMQVFLESQFTQQNKPFDFSNFLSTRLTLMSSDDPNMENLTYMRRKALQQFCDNLKNKKEIIDQALNLFLAERSKAHVPNEIQSMLKTLAKKFDLVAVSNGNCDVNKLAIGQLFTKSYSPVDGYRAKPHPQMLLQVCKDFSIKSNQLIHIGDSVEKDGEAARRAGVKFHLFNPFHNNLSLEAAVSNLISSVKEMQNTQN